MRIEIIFDEQNPRQWILGLRNRLSRSLPDAAVHLRPARGAAAYAGTVELLLQFEAWLRPQPFAPLSARADLGVDGGFMSEVADYDVVIDLTGGASAEPRKDGARRLRPLYDGSPNDNAIVAAYLRGAPPSIEIEDVSTGEIVACGLPSFEAANDLSSALESVLSRTITLLAQTLVSPQRRHARKNISAGSCSDANVATHLMKTVAAGCARLLYRLCCDAPHWRIGWRFVDADGALEKRGLEGAPWTIFPEIANSFAADPFPITWRGQSCVFFEQFNYRLGKGVISAQSFDAHGPVGEAFPVIEEPWHLSYPFLIEHGEDLYMLPEASASGALMLYRCVEFPRRWEPVRQLLTGIEAADATIFPHGGRFWMTSVVRDGLGGYSDTLAIHHAGDLFGPWEEHAQRPVLVDAGLARPAGAVVRHDGALWRPVQDCATRYGARLTIARIDVLDPENFVQTPIFEIAPGPRWPGKRLHTLNRHGHIECIDGVVFTPKNGVLRHFVHSVIDRNMREQDLGAASGAI